MDPPVGFSRATSSFATVDLPQPDSPTSPTVSPRRSDRLTPSTARTWPTVFLKTIPWVSGNSFCKSTISSSGVPCSQPGRVVPPAWTVTGTSGMEDLLGVVAGGPAAGGDHSPGGEGG